MTYNGDPYENALAESVNGILKVDISQAMFPNVRRRLCQQWHAHPPRSANALYAKRIITPTDARSCSIHLSDENLAEAV